MSAITLSKPSDLGQLLSQPAYKQMIGQAIPGKLLTVDRMIKLATTAANNTPKLLECNPQSLIAAFMASAQLGLEPNSPLGHAYLIPFGGKVQFIIGYKGLIALAYRGGIVKRIQARIVNDGDDFEYSFGLSETLRHVPKGDGPYTHAYALAQMDGSSLAWEVMTRQQIERVRNRSQGWQSAAKYGKTESNPWSTDPDEMAKKTVLRRLLKYLPLSAEVAQVADLDERTGGAGHTYEIDMTNPEAGARVIEPEATEDAPITAVTDKDLQDALRDAKARGADGDAVWDSITQANAPTQVPQELRKPLLAALQGAK